MKRNPYPAVALDLMETRFRATSNRRPVTEIPGGAMATIERSVITLDTAEEQEAFAQLKDLIRREFANLKPSRIEVAVDQDHEGHRVIIARVKHRLKSKPVRVRGLSAIDGKVRDEAFKQGFRHFVHIRHMFDEKQEVSG